MPHMLLEHMHRRFFETRTILSVPIGTMPLRMFGQLVRAETENAMLYASRLISADAAMGS